MSSLRLFDPSDRSTVGQPVVGPGGATSTSNPFATAAALEIYAHGGNAIDAAVAASLTLNVAEPGSSTLAGQAHITFREARTGKYYYFDAFAIAPGAAREDMYEWIESPTQGGYRFNCVGNKNDTGHLAIAVPAVLYGLSRMHSIAGHLPWRTVVQPAIALARGGFSVDKRIADAIKGAWDRICKYPETRRVFGRPDGSPLQVGDALVQPQLAETLEMVAAHGPDGFYKGPVADAIINEIQSNGGIMTHADLQAIDRLLCQRDPIVGNYRGYDVVTANLSTAGGVLLVEMLNVLEGFEMGPRASIPSMRSRLNPEPNHVIIEAMRIGFADRSESIGDPAFMKVDLGRLLSKEYAAMRRAEMPRVDRLRPKCELPDSRDTTHHSHVDDAGNVVAMTQSVGDAFGSAVVIPGTGVLMNNIMKILDPRPGRLNSIAPYKKPLSTMTPALLIKDGVAYMAVGSPSGTRIVNAVLQTLVNVIDFEMPLQAAVEFPRLHWSGDELEVEGHFGEAMASSLKALGHDPILKKPWDAWFGTMMAVGQLGDTGESAPRVIAVGDPRRKAVAGVIARRKA